jgi:inorganic phosphate transporter, PiT family
MMTTTTVIQSPLGAHHRDSGLLTWGIIALLAAGVVYTGISLYDDLISAPLQSALPYILLGVALLIALAFEMCNGFHDTSNAVATVIYTHSMVPNVAVVWSGSSTSSAFSLRVVWSPLASSRCCRLS